jgi:para-nitrobenzyl esterase
MLALVAKGADLNDLGFTPSQVTLDSGTTLKGKLCPDDPTTRCFWGVPYAEPPVGKNRFRPPQPYEYTESSINTKSHASSCMAEGGGDEDCLYLDIYAPAEGVKVKGVMYYVHGGCFVGDDPSWYTSSDLVKAGDVIVVVPYWRNSVFGFLGADQLRNRDEVNHSTGNYGSLDLIEGLKWVR